MKRIAHPVRDDWRRDAEPAGFVWHTADAPYWCDDAHWAFDDREIAALETAAREVYALLLEAGEDVIARGLLSDFGIPEWAHDLVVRAWRNEPPALNYGRFDFGWTGEGAPKLFEFNCDTPTALLEAAVVQWTWLEHAYPEDDQFNRLHDALLDRWRDLALRLGRRVHFTCYEDPSGEDSVTTAYMRDLAHQAGLDTAALPIEKIGWSARQRCFVDLDDRPIRALFKLYPWEWLLAEPFGKNVPIVGDDMIWIEPIWKMIWSNKRILIHLWELAPGHPNLLPAYDRPDGLANYVRKPIQSREGANVAIVENRTVVAETKGPYGEGPMVYQEFYPLRATDGAYPILGVWSVDGEPAGLGIREGGLITGNSARFIPHRIVKTTPNPLAPSHCAG